MLKVGQYNWELVCDTTGKCVAPAGSRVICNCLYCGKELFEKDGVWWTWDANLHKTPQAQEEE